jgi:hypothetical protein
MTTVALSHIQAAEAILTRIAFSGGEDSDTEATLALWRVSEGIDEGALEAAARASAMGTMREIEEIIQDGGEVTPQQLFEFFEREYMTAWHIAWITAKRSEIRARGDGA